MSEVSPSTANYYGDGSPDIDKQLDWLIENEEKAAQEKSAKEDPMADDVTEENIDKLLAEENDADEKGQVETAGSGKEENGSGEPAPERSDSSSPTKDEASPEPEPEAEPESKSAEAAPEQEAAAEPETSPAVAEAEGGTANLGGASSPQPGEDGDDYTLTDDQRQAMIELDNMKGDPEYDYLPDEDPPEYDVTERIKQLNAELETDGVPVDDPDREHKVAFKDNLVDLVAPPPVFSDDEDETDKESKSSESASDNQNTQRMNERENKVLIERDGKFELVDSDDPLAAEYGGGPPLATGAGDSSRSPAPPSQPRPNTANGYNRQQRHQPNRRVQSAQASSRDQDVDWSSGYRSPYALSDDQKAIKQERDKAILRRDRAKAEQKKEEEEEKKRDSEDAFQAWLNRKQEQASIRHQEERDAEKQKEPKSGSSEAGSSSSATNSTGSSEEDRDSESAFKEWLQVKAKQKQSEKEMEEEKTKEVQDGYYLRTRRDCDKAYRSWLKKKSADQKNCKDYKRKKQSVALLYMRRTRKSQALARAIQYSQSFRYVDYYGYRM